MNKSDVGYVLFLISLLLGLIVSICRYFNYNFGENLVFLREPILLPVIGFFISGVIVSIEEFENTKVFKFLKDKIMRIKKEPLNIFVVMAAFSFIIMGLSVAYYLVYRPYQKQNQIKNCNKQAYDNSRKEYSEKNQKIKYEEIYDRCLREGGF